MQQSWFPESAHSQRFYRVLHALRGCWATKLGSWECPHAMFPLCFTCFEAIIRVNKIDSLGGQQFQLTAIRSAQCPVVLVRACCACLPPPPLSLLCLLCLLRLAPVAPVAPCACCAQLFLQPVCLLRHTVRATSRNAAMA